MLLRLALIGLLEAFRVDLEKKTHLTTQNAKFISKHEKKLNKFGQLKAQ